MNLLHALNVNDLPAHAIAALSMAALTPDTAPMVLALDLPGFAGMLLLSPQPGAGEGAGAGSARTLPHGWDRLGGQIASALAALVAQTEAAASAPKAATTTMTTTTTAPLDVRYYPSDASVFLDGEYLIKGVAGAIFWKLARRHAEQGRDDFTTRELRLAGAELRLPDLQDNLDVRLLLLRRRLDARGGPVHIEKTGRGRFRFVAERALRLSAAAG